jgi:hypothetical protein
VGETLNRNEDENGLEAKTVRVLKEGTSLGVMVQLLPDGAIIIGGLQPEWPPWVKLEPAQARICISSDGASWTESNTQELWVLRVLDPRHVVKRTVLERQMVEGQVAKTTGRLDLATLSGPANESYLSAFLEEALPLRLALSIPVEIERENGRVVRITEKFPVSQEQLTLEFS